MHILRQKNFYSADVWKFAFLHFTDETMPALREFFAQSGNSLVQYIEPFFKSHLVSKQTTNHRKMFSKMLEYDPMINSRTHKIGQKGEHRILNKTLRETYDNFLQTVACKRKLAYEDKLIMIYYLQLQFRIEEACKLFENLDTPDEAMAKRDEYQLEAADKPMLEI